MSSRSIGAALAIVVASLGLVHRPTASGAQTKTRTAPASPLAEQGRVRDQASVAPPPLPAFDVAEERLRAFLRSHAVEGDLVWVWRDDVCGFRRRLFVQSLDEVQARAAARLAYAAAAARGLGARLSARAWDRQKIYCSIEYSVDVESALRLQIGGLSVSMTQDPPRVAVLPRPIWSVLRVILDRRPSVADFVTGPGPSS